MTLDATSSQRDGLVAVALLAAAEVMFAAALYGAALVLRAEQASFPSMATLLVQRGWLSLALAAVLTVLGATTASRWASLLTLGAVGASVFQLADLAQQGLSTSTGHAAGLWWIASFAISLHLSVVAVARFAWPSSGRLAGLVGAAWCLLLPLGGLALR